MKSKCKTLSSCGVLLLILTQTSSVVEPQKENSSFLSQMALPPPFANHSHEIQINSIPPPLDLNGKLPFSVWLNGKQLTLDSEKLKEVKKILGIKEENPNSIAGIHSGMQWLKPRNLK